MRLHGAHVDGEVRVHHLLFQRALQPAAAAGGVEKEKVIGIVVERAEEWDSLDVVPMKVGDEDVRVHRLTFRLPQHLFSEHTEACAAIENIAAAVDAHLDAGGVATIAQVFRLRSRRRTANSPELDLHKGSLTTLHPAGTPCPQDGS